MIDILNETRYFWLPLLLMVSVGMLVREVRRILWQRK